MRLRAVKVTAASPWPAGRVASTIVCAVWMAVVACSSQWP
jgi:hypothetical protein